MWISAPTRRKKFIRSTSSLPSWSEEVKDKKRRKGPSFSVVFSVMIPRYIRRFGSHALGFGCLKRESKYRFLRGLLGYKKTCCIFLMLGAILVANLLEFSSFLNISLLSPHLRLTIRRRSIMTKPQCRTKAFPLVGFMVKSAKGSAITDKSGNIIFYDFIEGEIFSPSHVMNDKPLRSYLAFDDDEQRRQNLMTGRHRDIIQNKGSMRSNHCKRTAFHRVYNPNCNAFHEIDILLDPGNGFVGYGAFRLALSYETGGNESFVLKILSMEMNFDPGVMEMTRIDALVMSSLTSSPRIVNIFGHCATSVATEDMPQPIESLVINGTGYATSEEIKQQESIIQDVNPQNSLNPNEKLTLALTMAEAIADLHGFKDGVIVHGDIQLSQFLFSRDGQLKLNDFNRAEILLWDTEKRGYCRYMVGLSYGNLRSPEEDEGEPLNEQIDVFSLGNNYYSLLTGLWVYYENKDDAVVQEKVKSAVLPFIDERYKYNRTYAERSLVQAIELCLKHDPDERVSIFQLVQFLRNAVALNAELI